MGFKAKLQICSIKIFTRKTIASVSTASRRSSLLYHYLNYISYITVSL